MKSRKIFFVLIIYVVILFDFSSDALAQSANTSSSAGNVVKTDIEDRIDQRNDDIRKLEQEIATYQNEINKLGAQASTLSSTIATLDANQKKLTADIRLTEKKIALQNDEIKKLDRQISGHGQNILENKRIIEYLYKTMNSSQISQGLARSVTYTLLGSDSLSEALNKVDNLSTLQLELQDRIVEIAEEKANLESVKKKTEVAKANLVKLERQLKDQRAIILSTKAEQDSLLSETKKSEAQYQIIVAEKRRLKEAFEAEILEFESKLKLNVDVAHIPKAGATVLAWPLDNIYITQHFGNTSFATANPQVYNGKGHTGIDLRAAIGTPVKSARGGTVIGVGNTDLVRGCYSYGKWIMVKHDNGLSTLYAHLSLPTVTMGQQVSTGQLLGYSGNTGYSTGPHLHFGVYASDGVQISTLPNSRNCRNAVLPTATLSAYLNPLSFLPKL